MPIQNLDLHMQQAVNFQQSGAFAHAESLYLEALQEQPRHPDILNLLGTVCAQQHKHNEALKYIRRALRLQPGNSTYLLNLGEALVRADKPEEAIKSFKQALLRAPQLHLAHYNLGNVYKTLHQAEAALSHYEQALALCRKPEYFYNYGNALRDVGRLRSATEAYQQALALAPQHAEAHNNLGTLLVHWDDYQGALDHYQQAVVINTQFDAAHHNLLQYYQQNDQAAAAQQHLTVLKRLRPEDQAALDVVGADCIPIIPQQSAEIDSALAQLAHTLINNNPQSLRLADLSEYNLAFPSAMIYYGRDDRDLRELYAQFIDLSGMIPVLAPAAKARSRPRIGFVVTQNHEGVFLKCMAGLISRLPEDYEVWLVCSQPNGQAILSPQLPDCRYLALSPDLRKAARQLQQADFDLLHYWEVGTDSTNYFLPFFKAARLQVTSWGWPVTSGIRHLDAFLSCAALEPTNGADYYTERLILCERLPIYYPPPPVPETVNPANLGVDADMHIYLCAQNLRKIQPEMDPLFEQILAQDPQGHLFFIADKRPAISSRFERRLQALTLKYENRIHMLERMEAADYLRWVKVAHVILDTTCYSGGANTNYDAFQAGTPVVTLAGSMHRSRFTTAAYTQMGYLDCVTDSPEDYVKTAICLATQPEVRQAASEAIIESRSAVIADQLAIPAFCETIGHLLRL